MCSKYRKCDDILKQLKFMNYNLNEANYNLSNSIHYNNIALSNILARFKQLHTISLSYRKRISSILNNDNIRILSLKEIYYENNFLYNLAIERIMKYNNDSYIINSSNVFRVHKDDFILLRYCIKIGTCEDIKLLYYNFIQILKMFALHNINITDEGNDIINYFDLEKTLSSTDNEDFFEKLIRHNYFISYTNIFKIFLKKYNEKILYVNIGLERPLDFYFIIYYDEDNKLNLGFVEEPINQLIENVQIFDFKKIFEYNNIFKKAYDFQKEYSMTKLYFMYKITKFKHKILNMPYKLGLTKNTLYNKNIIFNDSTYIIKELP